MYKINATFKMLLPVTVVLEGTLDSISTEDSFSDLSYDLVNGTPAIMSTDPNLDTLDLSAVLSTDDLEFIRVNSLTYVEAVPEPLSDAACEPASSPSVPSSTLWQTAVVQPLPEASRFTNIPEALRYVRA